MAGYAALLLTLPLLLYQAYAFVLPAFSPNERKVALPLMIMVPFLFYAGVVFAYFLVLPAAVDFLQNFNDDNYDVLLQARDYNKFAIMVLARDGAAVPAPGADPRDHADGDPDPAPARASTGATRSSSSPIVAALLPGGDPVTMILMMIPILFLYEGSILLARVLDRRAARARAARGGGRAADTSTLDPVPTDDD